MNMDFRWLSLLLGIVYGEFDVWFSLEWICLAEDR